MTFGKTPPCIANRLGAPITSWGTQSFVLPTANILFVLMPESYVSKAKKGFDPLLKKVARIYKELVIRFLIILSNCNKKDEQAKKGNFSFGSQSFCRANVLYGIAASKTFRALPGAGSKESTHDWINKAGH